MASAPNTTESSELTKELVGKIQQFLSHQAESNDQLSETAKESLTVAMECIEQAYSLERKPASRELLDVYRSHKQKSTSSLPFSSSATAGQGTGGQPNIPPFGPELLQNLTSSLFSNLVGATTNPQQQQPQQQSASATQASSTATNASVDTQSTKPKKTRKSATEAEKLAAESFKNQGNDLMKEDKYKEAHECYTRAIEIDDNNAIYYSNRAAASSKLGDHDAALRDCQEATEIDPTYSKAYGRMGLAYASLNKHKEAKEAYIKAVELDPINESYRNNLAIAEEQLAGGPNPADGGGLGGAPGNNMADMIRSVMGNQEVMSMAMRSLQDPRMQSVFGNILGGVVGNLATNVPGGGSGGGNTQPGGGTQDGGSNSGQQ